MTIEEQLKIGVSPVDLGNCTKSIKEFYNISEEENFIILNHEKKNINEKNKTTENNEDNSITLGKYSQIEIYDFSGRKPDLSVCKEGIKIMKYLGDVKEIDINSAKNNAELGIDIFNASSDFFNNICFQYKSNDGKDIVVNDRRSDIYKNVSFCQDGCIYKGMNYNLMIANCICDSNSLQGNTNFSRNKYNKTETSEFKKLIKSFLANLLDFNIDAIYCYNLVFNIPLLKGNIGFYFMGTMTIFQISCLIIFFFKRLKPIKKYLIKYKSLANPLKIKNKIKKMSNILKIGKKIDIFEFRKENNIGNNISSKKLIINNPDRDNNLIKGKSSNKYEISSKKILNNKKYYKYNHKVDILKNEKKMNNLILNDGGLSSNEKFKKIERKNRKINSLNIRNIKKNIFIYKDKYNFAQENIQNISNKKNCLNKIKLSQKDEDLQNMDFKYAIIKDKRSCLRIYWSYWIESQIILGTFFTENYLDLFIIKFSFFTSTFQISFFLNALFYTDEYISNAYHNQGILDFFTGLPKAVYSFIATLITTNLLKMLSNSKNELLQIIRNQKKIKNYIIIINNKLKKLSCKLTVYFTLIFIFSFLFLYYVSSFCAVYIHSQKYWFIGCLESFTIDSLVNFPVCIFISTLRFIAIHKKIKCLFVFVNIISVII